MSVNGCSWWPCLLVISSLHKRLWGVSVKRSPIVLFSGCSFLPQVIPLHALPPAVSVSESEWAEPPCLGQVVLYPAQPRAAVFSELGSEPGSREKLASRVFNLSSDRFRSTWAARQSCPEMFYGDNIFILQGKKWLFLLGWRDKVKLSRFSRILIQDRIFICQSFSYCGS